MCKMTRQSDASVQKRNRADGKIRDGLPGAGKALEVRPVCIAKTRRR